MNSCFIKFESTLDFFVDFPIDLGVKGDYNMLQYSKTFYVVTNVFQESKLKKDICTAEPYHHLLHVGVLYSSFVGI